MKTLKFLTLFPNTENIHLTKDVGMLPYILYKYFNYNSTIASYNNGNYPYLHKEVKGLKQMFISKVTGNIILDSFIFIFNNHNKFDILQVYHFSIDSLLYAIFFKIVTLGKGKTYLKLDANKEIMELKYSFIKMKILNFLLNRIDLVSVETKMLHKYLQSNWKREVVYLPNGFYDYGNREEIDFEKKENLIITVGRIGNYPKASEILCEGFRIFAKQNPVWKLKVIGPVEKDFEDYVTNYFIDNPDLKDRVIFTGLISDKVELNSLYSSAKIFVLTSRWESFGLSYLEAMSHGCFVISSNVIPAYDVTDNEKYGSLFPVDDYQMLANKLKEATDEPKRLKEISISVPDFLYENFYWPRICYKLDKLLRQ